MLIKKVLEKLTKGKKNVVPTDKSIAEKELLENQQSSMPRHVAIILDGNGRWATKRNLPKVAGHYAGRKALQNVVRSIEGIGIDYLTLYAFSTENWKRSDKEIQGLFKIFMLAVKHDLKELDEHNVKITFLGDIYQFPKEVVKGLEKTLAQTKDNTGMQINIAINYGGRSEILRATKKLAEDVRAGLISPEDIKEEDVEKYLYTGMTENNVPDPELIIRTSGEKRLSNYLLWQSAYSELVFSDVLWPDFTPEEFNKCIEEFRGRKRRFGGR